MIVRLAYGRDGLDVELPDDALVVEPRFVEGLPDELAAIKAALRAPIASRPLRDLVRPDDTVAIVFSDITRPTPNHRLLPPLLDELGQVPRENVVLINALGMHRHNTAEELRRMLGDGIAESYHVVNHEAYDRDRLRRVGRTRSGAEAWVNERYLGASVRILTGFIEPHLFAGFSGGGKAVVPGVAGGDTVMRNHGARMIGHPLATYGETVGNPIFEEMREVALMTEPTFLLNVTLNRRREVTGVFAGDLVSAHDAGIEFVRRTAMRPVAEPFDVVVTTNSGYPADLDLYQAVKGMKAASLITREGGAIVIAAGCEEGIGHGPFGDIMRQRSSPREILDMIHRPGYNVFDQWEAQVLCDILLKQRVFLYTDGLSAEQVAGLHLRRSEDVGRTVRDLIAEYGPNARLCVLPEGPQTIPYLDGSV